MSVTSGSPGPLHALAWPGEEGPGPAAATLSVYLCHQLCCPRPSLTLPPHGPALFLSDLAAILPSQSPLVSLVGFPQQACLSRCLLLCMLWCGVVWWRNVWWCATVGVRPAAKRASVVVICASLGVGALRLQPRAAAAATTAVAAARERACNPGAGGRCCGRSTWAWWLRRWRCFGSQNEGCCRCSRGLMRLLPWCRLRCGAVWSVGCNQCASAEGDGRVTRSE